MLVLCSAVRNHNTFQEQGQIFVFSRPQPRALSLQCFLRWKTVKNFSQLQQVFFFPSAFFSSPSLLLFSTASSASACVIWMSCLPECVAGSSGVPQMSKCLIALQKAPQTETCPRSSLYLSCLCSRCRRPNTYIERFVLAELSLKVRFAPCTLHTLLNIWLGCTQKARKLSGKKYIYTFVFLNFKCFTFWELDAIVCKKSISQSIDQQNNWPPSHIKPTA